VHFKKQPPEMATFSAMSKGHVQNDLLQSWAHTKSCLASWSARSGLNGEAQTFVRLMKGNSGVVLIQKCFGTASQLKPTKHQAG
jgi:hypothetical protein